MERGVAWSFSKKTHTLYRFGASCNVCVKKRWIKFIFKQIYVHANIKYFCLASKTTRMYSCEAKVTQRVPYGPQIFENAGIKENL